jgi:hypothetical protein
MYDRVYDIISSKKGYVRGLQNSTEKYSMSKD